LAGAKSKKKKWSKGKMRWLELIYSLQFNDNVLLYFFREKLNSKVLFDEDGWTRLLAEVPKMKLVTPSALCERLKINASLARAACRYLHEVIVLKLIINQNVLIYSLGGKDRSCRDSQ
jgi:small subunit ribosomal protein S25e